MSLASLTYPFLLVKSKISTETSPAQPIPPPLAGLHQLTFFVSDLDVSLAWYTSVMSASHLLAQDQYTARGQRCAAQLSMPAMGQSCLKLRCASSLHSLELAVPVIGANHQATRRLNHQEAKQARGSESVTWAVKSRAELQAWIEWLDVKGVKRSKILTGAVGWFLMFEVSPRWRLTFSGRAVASTSGKGRGD